MVEVTAALLAVPIVGANSAGDVLVLTFFAVAITVAVVTLRRSYKDKRQRQPPPDMKRADDAEREGPNDSQRRYRAAHDSL